MSDLISRQAAIDAINKSRFLVDAMEKVIKLPSAQPEQRWIPCSERLPEDIRPVIVTWKNTDPKSYYQYEVNRPKIGDRISFTLKTGEKVKAMAVRKLINGTVFCTVDYLDKPYPMNRQGGTRGGYKASDLRKILNREILDSFPDDIREQLIPFDNGDILTIPSGREMFGENIYADRPEDGVMQWEPMKDRRNRIALRDGNVEWGWLRNVANSTYFAGCSAHGNAFACYASNSYSVRPVFIMKKGDRKCILHETGTV